MAVGRTMPVKWLLGLSVFFCQSQIPSRTPTFCINLRSSIFTEVGLDSGLVFGADMLVLSGNAMPVVHI